MRQFTILALLFTITASVALDTADAWPRRRRSNGYTTYTGYSSGSVCVAPKTAGNAAGHRALGVYYDYDRAASEEVAFTDRFRIFMNVRDTELLEIDGPLIAEVEVTDLSDHESKRIKYLPVALSGEIPEGGKLAVVDVSNDADDPLMVKPASVYRVYVNLHRDVPQPDEASALGRVLTPYYVATSGESRVDCARRHIVMRTFKEFYHTEKNWRRTGDYIMDCHAFYRWATGTSTVAPQYGRASLGTLFGRISGYHSAGNIPSLATKGSIHGDYVRKPGHTFMLLAYDEKLGKLWTMEANYNHTIEVANRSLGSGWSVGHLRDAHIRTDLFGAAAGREAVEALTAIQDDTPPSSS